MTDPISFDEFVDLLRARLGAADALDVSALHDFRELMSDYADVTPDNWWSDAFEELDAQGHLNPQSTRAFGIGACYARLSADGRLYLRQASDS